jgi:hypothetical protein
MENKDFEKILNKRLFEDHREDLSEIIISEAKEIMNERAQRDKNKRDDNELGAWFLLPQPVLVCAFLLFLGAFLGMELESFYAFSELDMNSFIYIDEDSWL